MLKSVDDIASALAASVRHRAARGPSASPNLIAAAPFLATAPRGPRHPVIVLPGLGGDRSLDRRDPPLSSRFLGYQAHGLEPRTQHPAGRRRPAGGRRPDPLASRNDGHAGQPRRLEPRRHYRARGVAPRAGRGAHGHHARQSVRRAGGDKCRGRLAADDWRRISGARRRMSCAVSPTPLPVPSTSIYSRTDGVCAWRACQEVEGTADARTSRSAARISVSASIPPRSGSSRIGSRSRSAPGSRSNRPIVARSVRDQSSDGVRNASVAVSDSPRDPRPRGLVAIAIFATILIDAQFAVGPPKAIVRTSKKQDMEEASCPSRSFRRRRRLIPIRCSSSICCMRR